MTTLEKIFGQPKRGIGIILALLGTITPLAGLHKFYLGQPLWGIIYLLLWSTPIPRIACAIDAVWYLVQESEQFQLHFQRYGRTKVGIEPQQVSAIADALRKLDQLREDGLLSEYEFEQKRRQLLDRIA